jgi:hypothetical protein
MAPREKLLESVPQWVSNRGELSSAAHEALARTHWDLASARQSHSDDFGGRMPESMQIREEISEPLRAACARVVELFRRNDARDATDRYSIGCIIRDVRDAEHTYGQSSVAKIARTIGRDVDTLYEYADVAETWSEVELQRLLERKTPAGLTLSFTHLVVLSKVRRRRDLLKTLTDRALQGISARHLRELVNEQRSPRGKIADPTAMSRLKQLVTCCDRLLAISQSLEQCLSDLQSSESKSELVTLLDQAKERHRTLEQIWQENASRLEAAHEQVRLLLSCDDTDELNVAG